jgi:ribonuclease HI
MQINSIEIRMKKEKINRNNTRSRREEKNMNGGGKRIGIDVYTDGSCIGNGCPSAIGGIGVYFGPNDPYNTSKSFREVKTRTRSSLEKYTDASGKQMGSRTAVSSQAMEVAACTWGIVRSLDKVRDKAKLAGEKNSNSVLHIRIYTDSDYVIQSVRKDHVGERWRKAQNPYDRIHIQNLLRVLEQGHKGSPAYTVTFVHISAHTEVPNPPYLISLSHWIGNREADRLATESSSRLVKSKKNKKSASR